MARPTITPASARSPDRSRARARRSSSEPTPPLATSGTELAASTAVSCPNAGPSSVPSRPISVTTRAASPMPSKRRATEAPLAAPGLDAARAPPRELPAELLHQRRALHRGGADHHPLDPGVEQLERGLGRPHAAPHLDPAGDAADDQADLVEMRPGAGAG